MIYIKAVNKVTCEETCLEACRSRKGLKAKVARYEAMYRDYGQYGYKIEVEYPKKDRG